MSIWGKVGGALGGGIVGNLLLPGVGGLIGAGLGAGLGGGSSGKKNTSYVNLGSQSGLEKYLGGGEAMAFDQAGIDNLTNQINELKKDPNWKKDKAKRNQIDALDTQLQQLSKNPTLQRSGGQIQDLYSQLQGRINQGQDLGSYNNAVGAGNDLASMLQQLSQTGGLPGQQDINQANSLTNNLFAARKTALNQDLQDQYTQFNQNAGRRGAMTNDPVAMAKLRTGFMRQNDLLSAEQQAQSANIAMQLPGQRAAYAGQRYAALGDIANNDNVRYQQGLSNLQSLLGTGSSLLQQERGWRYDTAPKVNQGPGTSGGFMQGLSNALAVGGQALQMAGTLKMGSGFQGMTSQPTQVAQSGGLPYSGGFAGYGFGNNYNFS